MKSICLKILIIDPDEDPNQTLRNKVKSMSHDIHYVSSVVTGLTALEQQNFDIVLLDVSHLGKKETDLLKHLKDALGSARIIALGGQKSAKKITEIIRHGATDFLLKPVSIEEIETVLSNAGRSIQDERNLAAMHKLKSRESGTPELLYQSTAMKRVAKTVDKAAKADCPVLILGETGTGKELVARAIHLKSARAGAAFFPVNCGAFSDSLLANELFGSEKGSFTGAHELSKGVFEIANQGTIFLDEIGEASLDMQKKLLRVLESGEFRRIGGQQNLTADVRPLSATNKNLKTRVKEETFRQDLYYRLNTIVIKLPALRERREDIPLLLDHFLQDYSQREGIKKKFSEELVIEMQNYHWPGNVRELRNIVERLCLLSEKEEVNASNLPSTIGSPSTFTCEGSGSLSIADAEKRHITTVLKKVNGNRRQAARLLKISEPTLYRKLKEYGINL
ncbi:sigma-54-dependent transcriptional regulator [Planctomycetota bacterium]